MILLREDEEEVYDAHRILCIQEKYRAEGEEKATPHILQKDGMVQQKSSGRYHKSSLKVMALQ